MPTSGDPGADNELHTALRVPGLLVPIWTHSRKQIAVWFDDVMDYASALATPKIQ